MERKGGEGKGKDRSGREGHSTKKEKGPVASLTAEILRDDDKLQAHFQYMANLKTYGLMDCDADRVFFFAAAEIAISKDDPPAYFTGILKKRTEGVGAEAEERGRKRMNEFDRRRRGKSNGASRSLLDSLANSMRPAELPEVEE